jgi:hypothetical protein
VEHLYSTLWQQLFGDQRCTDAILEFLQMEGVGMHGRWCCREVSEGLREDEGG